MLRSAPLSRPPERWGVPMTDAGPTATTISSPNLVVSDGTNGNRAAIEASAVLAADPNRA
jgi:hypothetical protein